MNRKKTFLKKFEQVIFITSSSKSERIYDIHYSSSKTRFYRTNTIICIYKCICLKFTSRTINLQIYFWNSIVLCCIVLRFDWPESHIPLFSFLKCPVPSQAYGKCYSIVRYYLRCIVICFSCTLVFCCFVIFLL